MSPESRLAATRRLLEQVELHGTAPVPVRDLVAIADELITTAEALLATVPTDNRTPFFTVAPPVDLAQRRTERVQTLTAELVNRGDVGDILYEPLHQEYLGGRLDRLWGLYVHRESPAAPVEDLGLVEGYALDLGAERRIMLEIEAAAGDERDTRRRVHITWPGRDVVDCRNRAAELRDLGRLLSRPEVAEALARWADEDAQGSNAARQEGGHP